MLGHAFASRLPGAKALNRASLDVSNIRAIHDAIADSGADLVINCAAHTNVDQAETAGDDAWRANALLPGILGAACRASGAVLVHFSSTGIYGDWKETPYAEDDRLQPTTVHHHSKAAGEAAVKESGCRHLIVRTGWLFGGPPGHAKNFVWNRLVEAARSQEMKSDPSQRGNPTAVADVVEQTMAVVAAGYLGTINLVSHGSASRLDYVRRIVRSAGLACRVSASEAAFARPAPVSANETAVNQRLRLLGLDRMPPWEEAVDLYVTELRRSEAWAQLGAQA